VVAFLDRVNIGFAKLRMLEDLGFTEAVYGLGAGLFFIGYFLFEVPSNLILHRVGARRWIARIMITWAIISGATAFTTSATMFYVLRFLLGVAEAGFFPGIILYLSYWFPASRRAKVTALFMTAVPMSGVIGGPLSGWLLQGTDGMMGLGGWQWLLIIEALPAAVLGFACLTYLDDSIEKAKWLTPGEKAILTTNLGNDVTSAHRHSISAAFSDWRVAIMAMMLFANAMATYAMAFWLPTIIRATGVSSFLEIGLLSAIPFGIAAISMTLVARHSDRTRERRMHIAAAALVGAFGLAFSAYYAGSTALALAGLSFAAAGMLSATAVFWCLPTAILAGAAAAAGIAFINSIGNLAGFASPYFVGLVADTTDSTVLAIYVLAGVLCLQAVLVMFLPSKLIDR
jgi:MFS family permease